MKKHAIYLQIAFLIFLVEWLGACANIIPPTGGPRDSLPPVLVHANPPDSTTQFHSGKIVLTFNEYVELDKPLENIIVSPLPKNPTPAEAHLRTITIRIKDTLEPNTTYAINFGNSIRDINEGNVLKNFVYIFSTGNHFDSLELAGRVLLAETGKPDSTLMVMLHNKLDDSAVVKDRPRYMAHLDSSGRFLFRNLPPGKFALYALKDESGGQGRYTSNSQLFAFADSPVVINNATRSIQLFAFAEPEEVKPPSQTPSRSAVPKAVQEKVLRIQTNLESGQMDLLNPLQITFATPIRLFDTSKIHLTNEVYQPVPNVNFKLDTSKKILTVENNWQPGRGYNLIAQKDFAEDTAGKKLVRTDTLSFKTRSTNDYGGLRLRFSNLDLSKHPVLQFVQNNQVKYTHVFTSPIVDLKMFQPGEYELRILYDDNQNRKWDSGDFFKHKQPERVQALQRKLNVKGNWDNEMDITL
jgi:Bacterial Ig-like domain